MYTWLTVYLGTDGKIYSMRILINCDQQPLDQVFYNTGPSYEQLLWAVSNPAARITVAQLWAAPKRKEVVLQVQRKKKGIWYPKKSMWVEKEKREVRAHWMSCGKHNRREIIRFLIKMWKSL